METKMLWGILLIAIGAIMIINHVFGINLHVGRILVALFLIYLGAHMLFGHFGLRLNRLATSDAAIFSTSKFEWSDTGAADDDDDDDKTDVKATAGAKLNREYKTIFGDSSLDLTAVDVSKKSVDLDIKTIFSETRILVKPGTPIRLSTNTVFGNSELPGKNMSALGRFNYESQGLGAESPALNIHSDVVFGSFRVIEKL